MIFSTSPEDLDIAQNIRLAGSAALQAEVDSWEKSDELPPLVEQTLQTMIFAMSKETLDIVSTKDVRHELAHKLNLAQDCLRPFCLRLRNSIQRFIDEKEDLGLWSDDNHSDISSAGEGEQHRALNEEMAQLDEGEQLRALNEEIAQLKDQIAQDTTKNIKLQRLYQAGLKDLHIRRNNLLGNAATDSPETKPKFHPGQSMIQWWASWFKTATVVPALYNKTNRPAWCSGEVLAHAGYKSIKYAGIEQEKQHVYVCY